MKQNYLQSPFLQGRISSISKYSCIYLINHFTDIHFWAKCSRVHSFPEFKIDENMLINKLIH